MRQLNKLHYIKAICLSKLINPIGLKVKKGGSGVWFRKSEADKFWNSTSDLSC